MAGTGDEIEAVLDMPSLPDLDESILVERRYRAGAEDTVVAADVLSGAVVAEAKESHAEDAAMDDATMEDGAMEVANAVAAVEDVQEVDASVPRRWDTVHLHGLDAMRTDHIMAYFEGLAPVNVTWLHLAACNVAFQSEDAAAAALAARTMGLLHAPADATDAVDATAVRLAWHVGAPHPLSARILLRFATSEDRKRKPTHTELERYTLLHSDLAARWLRKHKIPTSKSTAIPAHVSDLRDLLKRPRKATVAAASAAAVAGGPLDASIRDTVARTSTAGKAAARPRRGARSAAVPVQPLSLSTRRPSAETLELSIPSRARAAAAALALPTDGARAVEDVEEDSGPGLTLRRAAMDAEDADADADPGLTLKSGRRGGGSDRAGRWSHDLYDNDDDDDDDRRS